MDRSRGDEDRRVLVTGAGTGIGREIALEFARQGWRVVVHYSHSGEGALSAVEEIRAAGGWAEPIAADFRDVAQVQDLGKAAVERLGGLDVLVNNAGITLALAFEEVTPEQYDTVYNVNIRAAFFLAQSVLPALEESRGVILNLSSVHAFEGYAGHSVYAGTKGALVSWTRELAIELAPRGVRINAIAPGAVPVENHARVGAEIDPMIVGRQIPCGFAGTPRDIARLAVFLASEGARYIVGQTIVIDGGTTSWMPFGEGFGKLPVEPFGKGYVPGVE